MSDQNHGEPIADALDGATIAVEKLSDATADQVAQETEIGDVLERIVGMIDEVEAAIDEVIDLVDALPEFESTLSLGLAGQYAHIARSLVKDHGHAGRIRS